MFASLSVLYVLMLRHHVAPEKATQRGKKKRKEALPSDNTSAANLCKTPKAPSLVFQCVCCRCGRSAEWGGIKKKKRSAVTTGSTGR